VVGADLTAFNGSRDIGRLQPRLNFYGDRQEPITTPAVRSRPNRDLYVNLLAFDENGAHATVAVIVEPLVFWIWFGGMIVGFGALVAALPRRRPIRIDTASELLPVEAA
jgi:cytochrome c-type biogenesis protein CcmF